MRLIAYPFLVAVAVAGGTRAAADWPTFRCDVRRSACSAAALPAELAPAWRRAFPAFEPAFPNEPRQQFDRAYEPVCAEGIVVVGSPVDGSVRGFSATDGAPIWCHYTEAPVRLAPVLHRGSVLFGSDDGTFRCLNLADGSLRWQMKAYPDGRPDMRLLGNNRLISQWPVRGGAVAADGVVYFAGGAWPTMGVTVHAVRVADGTRVWQNARLSLMDQVRIDHNKLFDAGMSPQGYLLIAGDRLVVPNGRSQPVALNRADGTLYHFVQGYRRGDCRVALGGDYGFVGKAGVISLIDFREVGNKWLQLGSEAPGKFDFSRFDAFEGPIHPYKHFAGCTADSVFDGETAYSLADGVFLAHDLSAAVLSEWKSKQGERTLKPLRWDVPLRMRVHVGLSGGSRLFLKAGARLYGHVGCWAVALELTGAVPPARVVWKHRFEHQPVSMIAAHDRLLVSLANGTLVCFSATGMGGTPTAGHAPVPVSGTTPADVTAVLEASRDAEGICVAVGALSAGEATAFLARGNLRLIALSASSEVANRLRDMFGPSADYGTRLEAFTGTPETVLLPACLASVLWLRGGAPPAAAALERLWRLVHPYGGALCYTGTAVQAAQVEAAAAQAGLDGCVVERVSPGLVRLRRPGGLTGAADWTHETADPARSHFSRDALVRAPLAPLWYGDGPDHGFVKSKDYGRGVKPQVVEGRVFALQQSSRTLIAYDAYTGRLLWKQQGTGDRRGFITRFVSRPEGIYAAGKGQCVVYDPATGVPLRTFRYGREMGADSGARASGVVVTDTTVLIAGADVDTGAIEKGLWDADMLICFDRETGELRWKRRASERFNIKALALGQRMVFCTDSMSPLANEYWQRRGEGVTECVSTVLALDEQTGAVRWQHQHRAPYRQHGANGWLSVRGRDDWLAFAEKRGCVIAGREKTALLLGAADGTLIWKKDLNLSQPIIVMGDTALDQTSRLIDLETGNVMRGGLFSRGGCNYAVANVNLAFLREQTVCTIDLETGRRQRLRNMRSGCSNSIIPACGIVSIPNFARGCVCNYPVQTSSAWIHVPAVEGWGGLEPLTVAPLRTGPELPVVSLDVAKQLHVFKRRFLVSDAAQAASHLLARWTFESPVATGPVTVEDRSGRAANLTVQNPAFESVGSSQALLCGSDAAKTCGRAQLTVREPIRDAVTLCAWVKLGEVQHKGAAGIVECPQYYRLMVDNTAAPYTVSLSVQVEGKSWRSARTPKTLAANRWYHIAGTFDGEASETRIFVDGVLVGEHSGTPCRIGGGGKGICVGVRDGGAFLNGALRDVRIYDRALHPGLITALSSAKLGE